MSDGSVYSGTPLTWYNGSSYNFTWKKGTQLASATKGSVTTTYDYDMSGVRSRKTVHNTTYDFATLSGLVMRQTWGAQTLDFVYDDSSQPYALVYNNGSSTTLYYYVLNQQGDVMALMNTSGAIVAQYQYDPWGVPTVQNPSGTTNTSSTFIGNINPLRYRGYYYDTETGFYYLQSRYYDPAIGRFISADKFATTDCNGFLSANMFAYCENNPVNGKDPNGEWVHLAVGAVIGGVVGGLSAAASSYYSNDGKISLLSVGIGVITGAVGGLLTATGVGMVGQVAGGAALAAVNSAGQQLDSMYVQKTQEEFNWDSFLRDTAIGAGCSILGGKGASYGNTKSIYNSGVRLVQSVKKGKSIARAWKAYRGNARATGGKFVLLGIAKSWAINSIGSVFGIWRSNR